MPDKEPEPPIDAEADSGEDALGQPDPSDREGGTAPSGPSGKNAEESEDDDEELEGAAEEPGDEFVEEPDSPADSREAASVDAREDSAARPPVPSGLPPRKNLSPIEIVSLAAISLLLLVAIFAFRSMVVSHVAVDEPNQPERELKGAVRGELLEIESAEIVWREPQPGERVKGHQALVPLVTVRLGGEPPGATAYLKAVFRDPAGAIRGDVTLHRVEDGKFIETGATDIRILGTEGFTERVRFIGYSIGTEFWSVELFEGPSYSGKDWRRLAYLAALPRLENPAPQDTN